MEPAFLKELRLHCVECDRAVLDSDDFTEIEVPTGPLHPDGIGRIHRECKRKRDEREERLSRERREEQDRLIRERNEEEHSLRPREWHFRMSKAYYGFKKDLEALEKEANEIIEALAKKHNLTTEKRE